MGASVRSAVRHRSAFVHRSPSLGLALNIVLALVSGCAPSTATPSPSPSTVSPTPAAATTPTASPESGTPAPSLAPTPAPTPVKPHWESAGAMSVARQSTHALALGDGRVLVVGDDRWSDEQSRYRIYLETVDTSVIAELWDPRSGKWRTTDPLPKPRAGFAAVVLRDGRALVAGGANQDCESYSSAYLFDPSKDKWSKTGLMRTARTQPAAVVLRDGRVLVVGGYFSRSCQDWPEMGYDAPSASPAVILAAFRSPIDDPQPGPRPDDIDPGPLGRALATAELFDPASGSWSGTGSMRMVRAGASAVTLGDGRVLVWGGREEYAAGDDRAEVYDPATGRFSWSQAVPALDRSAFTELGLKVPRDSPEEWLSGGTLLGLPGGGALLVGVDQWWGSYSVTRSFRFRPAKGTWAAVGGPLATSWESDTEKTYGTRALTGILAPLKDGRVLVARDNRKVELFDPGSGKWSKAPSMPGDRDSAVTVTLSDGSVLLVPVGQGYSKAFRFVPGS